MNVEIVKHKLMQMAFSGQLSSYNLNDTPIQKSVEEIESIHNQMIKEKKIKCEKNISGINYDEVYFSIPNTWCWTKFYYCIDVRDGTHDSPKYIKNGIPLITSKNLINGSLDFKNVNYIDKKDAEMINSRSKVDINDILFAMIGSIGNPVLVSNNNNFCIKNVALFKNPVKKNIDSKYLYYYLCFSQYRMKKESTGGLQPFVPLNYLRNFYFPLTSIEEQRRIVSRLDKIFNILDKIRYQEKILLKYKDQIKRKIISLSISGRTMENINYKLWKEDMLGNILKYEQPTKYIVDDEKYKNSYNIPVLTAGKTFILGYTNDKNGIFDKTPVIIFDDFTTESKYVDFSFKVKSSAMKILTCPKEMNIKYYYYVMQSLIFNCSTHKRYWISEYSKIIVPVPPREEQDRIVKKIDKMLELINQI